MLETSVEFLSTLPWYLILLSALFITFLENIFPPSPSDSVLVFIGTLVGIGAVSLIPLLLVATAGSVLGFALMFYLGKLLGKRVIKSDRVFFITEENIKKPTLWLHKYGYYLIAANRFMSGTRGVISFIAGLGKMEPAPSIALAAGSALIWNFILIYLGVILGENWRVASEKISEYGSIIFPIVIGIVVAATIYYFIKSRFKKEA